jgi:Lipid A 3-O-deacylase (PagL)
MISSLLILSALACGAQEPQGPQPDRAGAQIVRQSPAVPPLVRPTPPLVAESNAPDLSVPARPEEVSRWSISLEASDLFATTQNPFIFLVKTKWEGPNPLHYQLATQILAARYQLTKTGGWSFLRGNTEASLGIMYSAVLHGPEDYIVGLLGGFRYNFVPRHSRLSPYIEMRFGINETNSSHIFQGQQQDLTFGYVLGAGVSYRINPRWQVSLGTLNQHESDLFLTDPNFGFNVMGVSLGIQRHF